MNRKPNIIIFNPDEMRWDTMGHMGNPAAATPFLDGFAQNEAVSFRSAFCQNPVCVPSRCSFFTGLYPHVHGHRTMRYLLHPGEENLFSELKDGGYYVWMNARNDLYAGQMTGWAESNADEIFYGGNSAPAPGPEDKSAGDYSHFEGKLGVDTDGRNYNSDDEAVDAALSFLKKAPDDKPLCMFLGLMYPHVPYQVEEPYYSAIDRAKLPARIRPEECFGKSRMLELIGRYQQLEQYTEAQWEELRAVYLGMCMKVDEQFRRLCEGLKEAGIYDDSLIVFLSDHGDFEGDYGVTEKAQSSFEDCLCRVPLLIKPPKWEETDAGCTDSMAELVDFYATAMDYAGIIPRRTHFGRSLRPVLQDRTESIRDYVCCEGGRLPEEQHCDEYHGAGPLEQSFVYWPKMKAQTDDEAHAKATMIRTQGYKYVSRITGEDEFYDLKLDPGERNNQAGNPAYEKHMMELKTELMRWYQRTCDVVPYEYDQRFTDEMMWAKIQKLCPRGYEEDVRQKIHEGMRQGILVQYVRQLAEKAESRVEIYYGAVIDTGQGQDTEAMAVRDGKVLGTGRLKELEQLDEVKNGEPVYHDLKGAFVVPGFNDSHLHILNLGYTLSQADLFKRTASLEDVVSCMREFAQKKQEEAGENGKPCWILGRGWNHDYFQGEKRFPDRYDLDRVSAEWPVAAVRACGHIVSVNTAALKLAGVHKETRQPAGGCFDVDENGEPTGIFREYGMNLITKAVPAPDRQQLKTYLSLAVSYLNECGITSAQSDDLAVFPKVPYEEVLEAYHELEREGRLTVKVYEQSLLPDMESLKAFIEKKGKQTGGGSPYFRTGPLKIIGDGSLGARTARLTSPYADDKEQPGNRGIAIYSQAELDEMICCANSHGMQVAVHAIGDEAMDMAVSAIEKALKQCPREDHRHGIVHCQITRPDLLEHFSRLGLHAYIQSVFLDYDNHVVESRVGKERAGGTYQFKAMLDLGIEVSNGSDSPVERPDVLAGIYCAVTRDTLSGDRIFLPEQALTPEEALTTYTYMGARASFEEEIKGRLHPGMAADFTVLDRDIRACDPYEIKSAKVLGTYVDGICVFESGCAAASQT